MLFIDDYSRMIWVIFLKTKSEAFDKFKLFKAKVENECGHKIKCLRSDNGGEFTLTEFNNLCEKMESKGNTIQPILLNRMVLLKEKIGQFKKLQELFF